MTRKAKRIVVMGVSGCGKSSLGLALAQRIGAQFVDGDDLHSDEARAKMSGGSPLTDEDRFPWLERVGHTLAAGAGPVVVACSALRRAYRDRIRGAARGDVLFLHLDGPSEVIAARLAARKGHFMPPTLLASQVALLERPGADEWCTMIDLRGTTAAQTEAAVAACGW